MFGDKIFSDEETEDTIKCLMQARIENFERVALYYAYQCICELDFYFAERFNNNYTGEAITFSEENAFKFSEKANSMFELHRNLRDLIKEKNKTNAIE